MCTTDHNSAFSPQAIAASIRNDIPENMMTAETVLTITPALNNLKSYFVFFCLINLLGLLLTSNSDSVCPCHLTRSEGKLIPISSW